MMNPPYPLRLNTCAATYKRQAANGLRDYQRSLIDRHRGAHHHDRGALAIGDRDAEVVDEDHRPRQALEHDAAGRTGKVADGDAVLPRRLQDNARRDGHAQARQWRPVGRSAPAAADPDWTVRVP